MRFSEVEGGKKDHTIAYVEKNERWLNDGFQRTKDRICGYIFGLNAGGLVAGAAAIKELGSRCLFKVAIWVFAVGLVAEILRATYDYFAADIFATRHHKDADNLFTDGITLDEYFSRRRLTITQWPLYALGITSGVLFVVGLVVGLIGALN